MDSLPVSLSIIKLIATVFRNGLNRTYCRVSARLKCHIRLKKESGAECRGHA